MPKKFFFSVNLIIRSDSHLENTIASVISDEAFFLENIQLILIDSVCSTMSLEICTKYSRKYPDNIYFVDAFQKNDSECYNDAKALCTGKYIVYTNNYGKYSKKTFSKVFKMLDGSNIPVLCIEPMVSPSGDKPLPYAPYVSNGIIEISETPDKFILMIGCCFFSKALTAPLSFDPDTKFYSNIEFITDIMLSAGSYVFFDECSYTSYSPSELEPFRYEPQYLRAFYTQTVTDFIIPMLKKHSGSAFVQYIMLYLIETAFSLNADEKYKHVIIGNFIDDYFEKVHNAFQLIDDFVILNKNICRRCGLDEEVSFRLLRIKYADDTLRPDIDTAMPKEKIEKLYFNDYGVPTATVLSANFAAHVGRSIVGTSKDITAEICAVNFDREGLYIDAMLYGCSYLESSEFKIFVNINGEKKEVIPSDIYTLKKFFDIPLLKRFSFRFFVPISSGKTIDTIYLTMKYSKLIFRIGMTFSGTFSRLSSAMKNSYWHFLDRVMTYDIKNRSIIIRRATDSLLRKCEGKFMGEARKMLSLTELLYYRQLRRAAINAEIEKAENGDRKTILFYDETGINCNGNILFRYFSKFVSYENLSVFFTAKQGSDEYEFLIGSDYENVIETGSKKSKITAMKADVIAASDCDVYESLGFDSTDILMLKDHLNANIISVKNFFMTYATAQFDNRIRDNIQLLFCASEKEKQQLLKNVYDYNEAMIRVSGYPVLDALSDKREKLILIAPGERRQFCIYENSKHYLFSESRFFKLYNALLTDSRLHKTIRENGYELAVLLPQSIEKFKKLFHSDENVRIYSMSDRCDTDLINRASMLITDHSDIHYLFAYLDKPIAYYFPHGLPIQQEYKDEGLASSSFGELFFDHYKLIDYILDIMNGGFIQPEKYSVMCRDFFKYHDSSNSKRICHSIIKTFFPDLNK